MEWRYLTLTGDRTHASILLKVEKFILMIRVRNIPEITNEGPKFYKFSKKNFVAQETMDLNISWPCAFFRKYFMAPPINFSFLFKAYLLDFWVVLTVIFIKEVKIHNNIQK